MTQEEIILVAAFMDLHPSYSDGEIVAWSSGDGETVILGDYCPDEDWNELMQVVEKIQSIDITPPPNYTGYRIEIVVQGYVKIEGRGMPPIFTNVSMEGSLIAAIGKAAILFIKYHNETIIEELKKATQP